MPAPTFLPLTIAASRTVVDGCLDADVEARASAAAVHRAASSADATAATCWLALLAACDAPVRLELPHRLHTLCTATRIHTGRARWYSAGSPHRRRVDEARSRIEAAVRDGDGAEFAEAFVGYDHAVATAVVSAPHAPTVVAVPASRRSDDDATITPSR